MWDQVGALVAQKKTASYKEAISTLKDLRDLTNYQQRKGEFHEKLVALLDEYPTLRGLYQRVQEAGLV